VIGPGGITNEVVSDLSNATWHWTVVNYVGNRTEAEGLSDMHQQDANEAQAALNGLKASAQTSPTAQILPDLRLVIPMCLHICLVTAFLTNLGYALWLVVRRIRKVLRRYRLTAA
jgi:hypothetical protein